MHVLSAEDVARALDYPSLINAIDDGFRAEITTPLRHHHTVPVDGGRESTLLLMPAWDDEVLGIKTVMVAPENSGLGLPAVQATYQLFDRITGQPLALLDGPELTARRTAAASALASRYLSRPDASRLVMVGTGVLARHLIPAHTAVRPITEVVIWGRDPGKARAAAEDLGDLGLTLSVAEDLAAAVEGADIITCATLTQDPIVHGAWLKAGQHLDLVGGFTPLMREADDEALRRAKIFVDTRAGAMVEAGDICDPLERGIIAETDILAELSELARGQAAPPRSAGDEITLFKSAGTAIEDLAAAKLAFGRP